jgi:DNA polymerase V
MDASAIPLFQCSVPAGFSSAADDCIDQTLDINALLIAHPAATFFVRAKGDSMLNAGIHSGDILVVDRSLEPISGRIIIAILHSEFTVKRLLIEGDQILLAAENPRYPTIRVPKESDFQVWGTVTYVIKKCTS